MSATHLVEFEEAYQEADRLLNALTTLLGDSLTGNITKAFRSVALAANQQFDEYDSDSLALVAILRELLRLHDDPDSNEYEFQFAIDRAKRHLGIDTGNALEWEYA